MAEFPILSEDSSSPQISDPVQQSTSSDTLVSSPRASQLNSDSLSQKSDSSILEKKETENEERIRHKKEALEALTSSRTKTALASESAPVSPQSDSNTVKNHFRSSKGSKLDSSKRDTVSSTSSHTGSEQTSTPSDIIPNAIVIKNINFIIPRNVLLSTISQLNLPIPYAFNYHYEGGLFRGLAFANFHSNDDAAKVISGLNGLILAGRELKAEYKKVQEKPTNRQNIVPNVTQKNLNIPIDASSKVGDTFRSNHSLSSRLKNNDYLNRRATVSENRPFSMISPSSGGSLLSHLPQFQTPRVIESHPLPENDLGSLIDLSNKDTRLLYDLISQFRRDKNVAELDFPSAINNTQRQTVMLIAEHFGLNHETKNDNLGYRKIRVFKSLETLLEATQIKPHLSNSSSSASEFNSHRNFPSSKSFNRSSQQFIGENKPSQYDFKKFSNSSYKNTHGNRSSMYVSDTFNNQKSSFRNSSMHLPPMSDSHRARGYTNSPGNRSSLISFPGLSPLISESTDSIPDIKGSNTLEKSHNSDSRSDGMAPIPSIQSNIETGNSNPDQRIAQRHMQLKVLEEKRIRRMSNVGGTLVPSLSSPTTDVIPSSSGVKKFDVPQSKAIPIVSPGLKRPAGTITITLQSSSSKESAAHASVPTPAPTPAISESTVE
ncbi:RNA-binding protein PIN4 [Smittium mucronatum]|uniref:RNA-binding protein PIN4 n=1 Tax=Smittium mucronatum TaxID=133383 RepID=A0A1R0H4N7_9FUNG|nr:RNA-binding protein PIN4 [Smittium mucronatum]